MSAERRCSESQSLLTGSPQRSGTCSRCASLASTLRCMLCSPRFLDLVRLFLKLVTGLKVERLNISEEPGITLEMRRALPYSWSLPSPQQPLRRGIHRPPLWPQHYTWVNVLRQACEPVALLPTARGHQRLTTRARIKEIHRMTKQSNSKDIAYVAFLQGRNVGGKTLSACSL
jgi:hypothetical protein